MIDLVNVIGGGDGLVGGCLGVGIDLMNGRFIEGEMGFIDVVIFDVFCWVFENLFVDGIFVF